MPLDIRRSQRYRHRSCGRFGRIKSQQITQVQPRLSQSMFETIPLVSMSMAAVGVPLVPVFKRTRPVRKMTRAASTQTETARWKMLGTWRWRSSPRWLHVMYALTAIALPKLLIVLIRMAVWYFLDFVLAGVCSFFCSGWHKIRRPWPTIVLWSSSEPLAPCSGAQSSSQHRRCCSQHLLACKPPRRFAEQLRPHGQGHSRAFLSGSHTPLVQDSSPLVL